MTDHPAKGCSKRQREAFERIACGDDTCLHSATAKALEDKGLIVGQDEVMSGWPRIRIRRYHVPLQLHAQWSAWCSEQPAIARAVSG